LGGFEKLKVTGMSSKKRMTMMSISMSRGTIRGMTRMTRGITRITRMMKTTRTIMPPDANDNERQQTIIPVEEEADAVVRIRAMKGQVIRKVGAVVGQVI
jgi:hypothetical protein